MKPTVGRTVHYKHTSGEVLAAIIIKVNDDDTVALQIFRVDDNYQNKHVPMANGPDSAEAGQWYWPDRIGG
jgi:hypothetical protein